MSRGFKCVDGAMKHLGSEHPLCRFGDVPVYLTLDTLEFRCHLEGDYEGAEEGRGDSPPRLTLTAPSLEELEEQLKKVSKRRPPLDLAVVLVDSLGSCRFDKDEAVDPADVVSEPMVLRSIEAKGRTGFRVHPHGKPDEATTASASWLAPAGAPGLAKLVELVRKLNAAHKVVTSLEDEYEQVADEVGVDTSPFARHDLASVAKAEADLAAALRAKGAVGVVGAAPKPKAKRKARAR